MAPSRRGKRRAKKQLEVDSAQADRPRVRVTLDPPGLSIGGVGLGFEMAATEAAALTGGLGGSQVLGGEIRGGVLEVGRGGMTFDQLKVAFPGSRIILDGHFEGGASGMEGDARIEAKPLDLDDLLARLDVVGAERRSRSASRRKERAPWPDLRAEMALRQVRFRGIVADRVEGTLAIEKGLYRLDPLSLQAAGGTLEGILEGPTPGGEGPARIDGRLHAPEIKPLLSLMGVPSMVSGGIDATVDVSVERGESWQTGGRGRFRIDLRDGRLHTVRVVGEVLAPLVPSLVSGMLGPLGRLTEFEAFGTHFHRLFLEGSLERGRLILEQAQLEAFGMTSELVGSMATETGALELKGTVRVDAQLLERFGIDSAAFSIPVSVRGTLRTPRILPDVDELRALASQLRLRSLPGRLLDDVNERLRSFTGRVRAEVEGREHPPAPPARAEAAPPEKARAKRKAPPKKRAPAKKKGPAKKKTSSSKPRAPRKRTTAK